ncbi:MAG: RRXRR domain-containing protein [Deltaproteobacteria bacterium]|nr:RRXRR domain-containing protein [Deltaproteobacteria bacterium]
MFTSDEPLRPTCPALARIILKSGRAKVVRREPFTIKTHSSARLKSTGFLRKIL